MATGSFPATYPYPVTMKPTLLLSTFLIAFGTCPAISQDSVSILPLVPVDKEVPSDDEMPADDEETGDQDEAEDDDAGEVPDVIEDPAPDDWFPGGWDPNWLKRDGPGVIYHTAGGIDDDPVLYPEDPAFELDPVIFQTGVPAPPKQSRKEKMAALAADIEDGCAVAFEALDADDNGSLDPAEFAARRPGAAATKAKAFRRADKNRDGGLSVAEFSRKGSVPLVMPASLGVLEAHEVRLSFNTLDFDGNGFLTFGEFTAVLRPSGPGVLEAIFAEADRNGDGKVSFAEYTHRPVFPAGVE
jgi:Ca2+-binding EF-hand superfamily protein